MLIALNRFQQRSTLERLERLHAQVGAVELVERRAGVQAAVDDAAERIAYCELRLREYATTLDYTPGFVRTSIQSDLIDRLINAYATAVQTHRALRANAQRIERAA